MVANNYGVGRVGELQWRDGVDEAQKVVRQAHVPGRSSYTSTS